MATLTPSLSLVSTDSTSDALSFTVSKAITIGANQVRTTTVYSPNDLDPGGVKIFDNALGKSFIYAKNTHASKQIYLALTATEAVDSDIYIHLGPGEFAFFPWAGIQDLFAHTGANGQEVATNGLEVMIFEV